MIVQALSDITIEALDNEQKDDVDIIMLGLYLHLGLVKAALEQNNRIIKRLFDVHDGTDWEAMRVVNQRAEMEEIVMDFKEQQQQPWLVKWMQVCSHEFQKEAVYYAGDLHADISIRTAIHLIHKQLGITKETGWLLYDVTRYILAAGLLNEEK